MDTFKIKDVFLQLCKTTCPYGNEDRVYADLIAKGDLTRDPHGNYFLIVGAGSPATMFTSHFDTADRGGIKRINQVMNGDIVSTDGSTILGADCRAGVAVMLGMIEARVGGLYYFFVGEEVGRIGSEALANASIDNKGILSTIERCVSFDRRGKGDVITHQMGERTCSSAFAGALATQLGGIYKPDPTGSFTDSYSFRSIVAECTNVSIGYENAHTHEETQDLDFLESLLKTLVLVDWDNLPTDRDPSEEWILDGYGYDDESDQWVAVADDASAWDLLWDLMYHTRDSDLKAVVYGWMVENPDQGEILIGMMAQHATGDFRSTIESILDDGLNPTF